MKKDIIMEQTGWRIESESLSGLQTRWIFKKDKNWDSKYSILIIAVGCYWLHNVNQTNLKDRAVYSQEESRF